MCCASSCTAGLPLLLLRERKKDIGDVAAFASCAFCIIKRNKEKSVVEKYGFMTAGCGGLPWAASGCLGLSRLSLRVAAGVNCASVLGDCHHINVEADDTDCCSL